MDVQVGLNFKQKNATRLLTGVCALIGFALTHKNINACVAVVITVILMLKNQVAVYTFYNTIGRDLLAIQRFLRLQIYLALMDRRKWSIARIFQETMRKYPHKSFLVMEERSFTFQEIEVLSNKVGAYFKAKGLKHGDCVALLMETRPEYICFWLGLSKLGVCTALINTHLRRDTLLHSIKIAKAKAIILGTELASALEDVRTDNEVISLPIYQFCDEAQRDNDNFNLVKDAIDLTQALNAQIPEDLSSAICLCTPKDKLLYVYTSGTTGLPKAAVITNSRYLFMAAGAHYMIAFTSNDVIYNPLPLYHTAGGIVGVGIGLTLGCTVVLRKKFSASNFWKDCIKYNCTVAQYIGELCRYLLSSPAKPEDTQHNLRLMYGNGLRPQIWSQFVSRFNIPHIGEVYGSTEGNSNLANITNRVGAVGFIPCFAARRFFPVQLVKCDEESGEPIRNSKGFCIRCAIGETGLLVGQVDARRANTAFHGYADKEASEKKLMRNVFRKGDCYFNSGDMVVFDILGFVYFKDRTGDTFRWRGENVATLEVEAIITNVIGLKDCVVYGVEIPHVEGKAGMAAIVDPDRKVDLEHLFIGIRGSLPVYAQPLFIRLMNEIPRTATFKMKKRDLMMEAFDINKVKDPIYYLNKDGVYRQLDEQQYNNLMQGKAGL